MPTRFEDKPIELTAREREVLKTISINHPRAYGTTIADRTNTSPAGAHRTAASLVRKKLAERLGTSRLMWYGITPLGREVLRRGK